MKKKKKFSIFKILFFIVIAVVIVNLVSGLFSHSAGNVITNNNNPIEDTDDGKNGYTGFANNVNNNYSNSWQLTSNVGKLDLNTVAGIRDKRTSIVGSNKDTVTVMVYMCGSDLESQAAMGVYDLQEMASANLSDRVNVIVYTGGTKSWHTDIISSRVNQIYQIVGEGKIRCLEDNAGTGAMVDPSTLTSFIEYCADNFPANRFELIMWDHGGGIVSGYGYDEKYPNYGSMSPAQFDRALTSAGVQFDFVGFDACLMATTETALLLAEHADYMIASEESEPGIGWYYTNWLSKLSSNTSMPTIEIGKNIADDFVSQCASQTPNQTATLSVIDLAEAEATIPNALSTFAKSTIDIINTDYHKVASARKGSREFAADAYLDLVDFVDLAAKIDTTESKQLAQTLMSAVKYNNTSRDISNAYGLSIYFPYRSTKYVNTVLTTYNDIQMNSDYSECVRSFATYQTSGQVSSGGSHYAYQTYNNYNGSNYYDSQSSEELLLNLMELFMGGSYSSSDSYDYYYGRGLDKIFNGTIDKNMVKYVVENHFDADLNWKDGKIALTEKQWSMISDLLLNVFVDDGTGYIDLGKDNIFEVGDDGSLLAPSDKMWLAASVDKQNWEIIPYYYMFSSGEGDDMVTTGRIPVILNGKDANLIVKIDDAGIKVTGAIYSYGEDVEVVAKSATELAGDNNVEFTNDGSDISVSGADTSSEMITLKEGDEIEFVCDFYDYDGVFTDNYVLGDKLTVKDDLYIGDVDISTYKTLSSYEIRDIYQQSYFTQAVK